MVDTRFVIHFTANKTAERPLTQKAKWRNDVSLFIERKDANIRYLFIERQKANVYYLFIIITQS